ncbi:MAG: Tetratricopeptide repeat protein [Candidatus Midichloria mitochondrii]|uniref:Uncharacterized protein n=1 Tax=Midichloria mitochondrii (strain IricVA) TaxID=696127 RepID=F7XW73_MIDMI|nr:hypothetical protein midi_00623 [Candidatus Midichloria mitochondrii IricVA]MDJ1288486.1 hypothetical protein [Candidatus Midichloria mitochondrii]
MNIQYMQITNGTISSETGQKKVKGCYENALAIYQAIGENYAETASLYYYLN